MRSMRMLIKSVLKAGVSRRKKEPRSGGDKSQGSGMSQRAIRYFFKFNSINGGNLLTANLIFASEALITCLSRSCLGRVSFSPPSGGLSPKKAAVNQLCGVSLMFFFLAVSPVAFIVVKLLGWTGDGFAKAIRLFGITNLFCQVVPK